MLVLKMPNRSSTSNASMLNEEVEIVEEVEVPQEHKLDYSTMTLSELKGIAKERGIEGYSKLNKSELIEKLG